MSSAIESAIEEAVEKGAWHDGYHLQNFGDFGDVLLAADKGARSIAVVVAEIFLDPLFWQALGKARGWFEKNTFINTFWKGQPRTFPQWQYKWHRFIDHLAEGKDAESFFESL